MTSGDQSQVMNWKGMRRHFMGWDRPLFQEALAFLSRDHKVLPSGDTTAHHIDARTWDLSGILIVTSSRSAGRKFQMRLAAHALKDKRLLIPPAHCSPEELPEKLYQARKVRHPLTALRLEGIGSEASIIYRRAFIANQDETALKQYGLSLPGSEEALREMNQWYRTVNELRRFRHIIDDALLTRIEMMSQGEFTISPRAMDQWRQLITLENDYQSWLIKQCESEKIRRVPLDQNVLRELALAQPETIGPKATPLHVLLLGVLELPPLTLELIRRYSENGQVSSLIQAPADHAPRFDLMGCLRPECWFPPTKPKPKQRMRSDDQGLSAISCDLEEDQIFTSESTTTMAALSLQLISSSEAATPGIIFPTDQIAIFTTDESRNQSLSGIYEAHGLTLTGAGGKPLALSPPMRLLQALKQFAEEQTYQQLGVLLRQPHLLDFLELQLTRNRPCVLTLLDDYGSRFLPQDLGQLRHDLKKRGTQADKQIKSLLSRLDEWLRSGLSEAGQQSKQTAFSFRRQMPLSEWLNWLRQLMRSLYVLPYLEAGSHAKAVDKNDDDDNAIDSAVLMPIDAHLSVLQDMPLAETLAFNCSQFLSFFAHGLSHERVPESHVPGEIELLGWLEIYLNDSPCKVLLGATLESLPAKVASGGRWLTPVLRQKLGLETDDHRLARDLCILKTVNQLVKNAGAWSGIENNSQNGPPALSIILPKQSADGQPLSPSPLLFAESPLVAARRLKSLCVDSTHASPATGPLSLSFSDGFSKHTDLPAANNQPIVIPEPITHETSNGGGTKPPIKLSVTSLKIYLNDPYQYFLEKVLKLKMVREPNLELDALAFGNLAHDALNEFALTEDAKSANPETIEKSVAYFIKKLAGERFGSQPTIAIQLQVEQLLYRIKPYAYWHAAQSREGWRVVPELVEWTVKWPFTHDGHAFLLEGRLDRVDYHDRYGYRVIDFKTTEAGPKPRPDHVTGKGEKRKWKSLQLPVYRRLMVAGEKLAEHELDHRLETGYFLISSDVKRNTYERADFTDEELQDARRVFESALNGIARQHFFPNPDRMSYTEAGQFDSYEAIRLAYAAEAQSIAMTTTQAINHPSATSQEVHPEGLPGGLLGQGLQGILPGGIPGGDS